MKIFDITKELFSSKPFPGDPHPEMRLEKTLEKDGYNLTVFSACAHNATHIDAPSHFLTNSSTVSDINIEKCMGKCMVCDNIDRAMSACDMGFRRIILKDINVTPTQAGYFAERAELIGISGESIGSDTAPGEVHRILLSHNVVILENLELSDIECGEYGIVALPLKMKGSDGSPVRAVLLKDE